MKIRNYNFNNNYYYGLRRNKRFYESEQPDMPSKEILKQMKDFSQKYNDSIKIFIKSIFDNDFNLIEGEEFVEDWNNEFNNIKNELDREIKQITDYKPTTIISNYGENNDNEIEDDDEDEIEDDDEESINENKIKSKKSLNSFSESYTHYNSIGMSSFFECYQDIIKNEDKKTNYDSALDFLRKNKEKKNERGVAEVTVIRPKVYVPYMKILVSIVSLYREYMERALKHFELRLENLYSNFSKYRDDLGKNQSSVIKDKLGNDISDEVSEYAAYILIKLFNISSKTEGEFLNISFKQNVILNNNQKEDKKDKKDYVIKKLNTEEIDKNNKEIQKLNNNNILYKDSMEDEYSCFHQTQLDKDKESFSIYLDDSLADKNITFSFKLAISEKIKEINGKKNNIMTFNYIVLYKSR